MHSPAFEASVLAKEAASNFRATGGFPFYNLISIIGRDEYDQIYYFYSSL